MTFLIACILIHHFNMGQGWYIVAFILWVFHLAYYDRPTKS